MPERYSPDEIARQQVERVQSSTERMAEGIRRVAIAPGMQAAKKQDKMLANLTKKVKDGTWAENVSAVDLGTWQNTTIEKGVPRVAEGIRQAESKIVEFHRQRSEHQKRIDSELASMPDTTLDQNLARMSHQVRRMAEFKFRKRR